MTLDVNADYVSSPQAAKILRITYVGVAQLARQGKIPAVKIANRWLIPRAFLEDFARTYEGRRGRPRKRSPRGEVPVALATAKPIESVLADSGETPEIMAARNESGEIAATALVANLPETPALPSTIPSGGLEPADPLGPVAAADSGPDAGLASTIAARVDHLEVAAVATPETVKSPPHDATLASETGVSVGPDSGASLETDAPMGRTDDVTASAPPASEVEMHQTDTASQAAAGSPEGDGTFAASAEVFHLDKNYDFEVYEKGEITEHARLIVARLKPKIPSLPHFSFRWDYRYQHLNVDIHGVEPAVTDWWTMGENGYTGHLPRRLGGQGYSFEAIIWLPVTFVFRGRLTLSLRESPADEEESSSVAATTGGLRRLWTRWARIPRE